MNLNVKLARTYYIHYLLVATVVVVTVGWLHELGTFPSAVYVEGMCSLSSNNYTVGYEAGDPGNTPREKHAYRKIGFWSTKSGAGLQLQLCLQSSAACAERMPSTVGSYNSTRKISN